MVAVRHKDDPNNMNGNVAEYDVVLFDRYVTIPNVQTLGFKNNEDSGDEYTLKACTYTPDLSDPTQADNNFLSSDGDLVVVMFLSGIYPVIVGTINHARSGADTATWHGETADGERRAWHHKGTSIIIEDDSTVEINLPVDKDFIINIDGNQLFKVVRTGGANTVELGNGAEKVILGESFQTWWDTNIANHVHAAGTLLDSMAGPVSGATAVMGESFDPTTLSDVTKTE